MKSTVKVGADDLKKLLNSINKTLGKDDDADVHMQASSGELRIFSRPGPFQVSHHLSDGDRIEITVEETGSMSINIETLVDIVKKAPDGEITLIFGGGKYRLKMPEEEDFSEPLKFKLPSITQSEFRAPESYGGFHKIDTVDRSSLSSKLEMFHVLDEHLNIRVEGGTLYIEVNSPVNGSGDISRDILFDSEVSEMSQWYPIRPLREFVKRVQFVNDIELLTNKNARLCARASIQEWESSLFIAKKTNQYVETKLSF